jgi:hypothetical protein
MYGIKKRKTSSSAGYSNKRSTNIRPYVTTDFGSSAVQKPEAYAQALLDPENSSACIIPDLNTFPTSVYSSSTSFKLTVNSSTGTTGALISLSSNPNNTIQDESATSTDGAYNYNSFLPVSGAVAMTGTYRSSRIVAASLRIEHCGNDNLNEGIIVATSYGNSRVDSQVMNLVSQQNTRNTYVGPAKNGCIITYRPVDGSNFDMHLLSATLYSFGYLQVHLSGCASGANIQAHLTIHYEGLTTTSSDIDFAKVYCDPDSFNITRSTCAGKKPVGAGDNKAKADLLKTAIDVGYDVATQCNALDLLKGTIKYGPQIYEGYKYITSKKK